jgi:hypothetical protein
MGRQPGSKGNNRIVRQPISRENNKMVRQPGSKGNNRIVRQPEESSPGLKANSGDLNINNWTVM